RHAARFLDAARELRPRTVPSGDENRVAAAFGEPAEGRERDVLTLSQFELSAAENQEAVANKANARGRVKQAVVNALQNSPYVRQPICAQHLLVPAGSGDDERIARRGRDGFWRMLCGLEK